MSSYEVVERGAAAGIVITASHNPWVDNGFKVKAPTGAAAGPDILAAIEARLAVNGGSPIDRRPFADAEAAGLVERFDPFDGLRAVRSADGRPRRAAGGRRARSSSTRCGAPGPAGSAGCWPAAGSGSREIHQERNPYFGGVNPEPIRPEHRRGARRCSPAGGYDLGLLLDGDADRAGAADERGTFIHQLQVTGLLMYYLAEHRGWRDPVVVSVNNTSMAARLGEHYGIATHETPVGFKFIGPKMIETGAMMGAEESGGFGFGMHLPERDGVYADLLLLDLFLREQAAGRWPVSTAPSSTSMRSPGRRSTCAIDVHVERAAYPEIEAPTARRPCGAGAGRSWPASRSRGPCPLDTGDGFKFFLADGSWLLIRTSGTEPLVRVYTEATSEDAPRRDARRRRAPGARLVSRVRRRRATPRREAVGPRAHLGPHRPRTSARSSSSRPAGGCRSRRHEIKDESILVISGRLRLHLEDDAGDGPESRSSDRATTATSPTGRLHRYEAIERTN